MPPTPPLRSRDQHRPVGRLEAAFLQCRDRHRRGEPGGPDGHRIAGGQARCQRHDPARRHALVFSVSTVPGDADVVTVSQHRVPRLEGRIRACHDLAGEVDPGDQRADPGDLAIGPGREAVLVVDARPADADLDFARGKVGGSEVADAALDLSGSVGAFVLLSDIRAECPGDDVMADSLARRQPGGAGSGLRGWASPARPGSGSESGQAWRSGPGSVWRWGPPSVSGSESASG